MSYKLIAIDMDGTLLNDEKKISNENKEAIHMASQKGVKIVISTGRPYKGVTEYLKELEISTPVITYHGATIVENGKTIYSQSMIKRDVLYILSLAIELDVSFIVWSNELLYSMEENDLVFHYQKISDAKLKILDKVEDFIELRISKITWLDTPSKIQEFVRLLGEKELIDFHFHYFTSRPDFLEFVDERVSKGNAIRILEEYFSIKHEEVIAIGDGYNDLSMIQYASCGVAMDNADDYIKSCADYITLSNNEHGVAHVIHKFIKK